MGSNRSLAHQWIQVVLVLVLAVSATLLTGCGTVIPDIKGMTVMQAEEALKTAGFQIGKVSYDGNATGAVGAVVAQTPEAGKRGKQDSLVIITVAGPPPVATPKLSGLNKAQVTAALVAVGLELGEASESYDATAPAGNVTTQTPAAGVEAPRGAAVAVTFSKGPEPVAVPVVTGKSEKAAKSLLLSSGFKVKSEVSTNKAKKGTVVAQKPAKGNAQPGSTVTIMVSSGIQLVRVPNIVGMVQHEVSGFLAKSKLASRNEDWDTTVEMDTAVRQSPKAGTMVEPGTAILFWVR